MWSYGPAYGFTNSCGGIIHGILAKSVVIRLLLYELTSIIIFILPQLLGLCKSFSYDRSFRKLNFFLLFVFFLLVDPLDPDFRQRLAKIIIRRPGVNLVNFYWTSFEWSFRVMFEFFSTPHSSSPTVIFKLY